MAKQIPFRCRLGHVSIKSFLSSEPTPNNIKCEYCLIKLEEDYITLENSKHTFSIKELIATRF